MRFSEILTESRQAPLFHATSLEAALTIITSNKLTGTTGHRIDARRGKRYKIRTDDWHGAVYGYKMKGGWEAKGVSLTRDYNFASNWQRSTVIFVLDQSKLAQTNKIVPVDHTHNGAYDYAAIGFEHMEQAEEFAIGDIAPLSSCLVSINVRLSDLDRVDLEQFIDQRALWGHPALNRWYPRNQRAQYDRGYYEAEYDDVSYLNRLYRQMRKNGKTVPEIIAHMRELASRLAANNPPTDLDESRSPLAAVWSDVDASGTVTEGIAAAEDAWRGGIANFGDHQAASLIQRMPGYDRYVTALRQAVERHLDFPLVVYRSGPADALEAFIDSPETTAWATSLSARSAQRFAKFAGHAAGPKVLVEITLHDPQAIIMRGKLEEAELVINTWEVSDDIRVVKRL